MEGDEKSTHNFWDDYSQEPGNQASQNASTDFITPQNPKDLKKFYPRKEKIAVVLVSIACLAAVILIFYQFNNSLNGPMNTIFKIVREAQNQANPADSVKDKLVTIVDLKNKDTDGDGLSDYDELYIYKTSPYLEDTDGDNYEDKQEIDGGHDPNCAGRDDCSGSGTATNTNGNTNGAAVSTTVQTATIMQQQALLSQLISGQADAATVRAILIQSGLSAETVNAVSDTEILALYQQTISGNTIDNSAGLTNTGLTNTASQNINTSADLTNADLNSIEGLKSLTGAQIRALLIQQGASAEQLASITDDQLKAAFLEKLNSEINNANQP